MAEGQFGTYEGFIVPRVEESEANNALAKAIVGEFFEQLSERVEFRTWIHTELSAAVLGNYNTHIVLDRKKD